MAYVRRTIDDLSGGVDEASPETRAKFIKVENWRTDKDGLTKVKRKGLSKLDTSYSFSSKKVFGSLGVGELDETEILACLEDDVQLKRGAAWSSIFSPTRTTTQPVSIVKEKGLTLVAGYEKLITVKDGAAFYSGIEAPATPPTGAAGAASAGIKIVEHDEDNQDACGELRAIVGHTLLAQSFKLGTANEVSSVKLKLRKQGTPATNVWVEIHSSQEGTSATKNTSTNIVGQASDNVAIAGIGTTFATHTFTFSGTKPSLSADTTYYLVVYGDYAVSTTNYVIVGYDVSSPAYTNGRYWKINATYVWTSHQNSVDMVFEIYGEATASGEVGSYGAQQTGDYSPLRNAAARTLLSQSFELDADSDLSSVKLALKKYCGGAGLDCPSGNVWVEIHSSTAGTSGTKNASTNIVGQASDDVDVDNIPEGFDWIEFTFSGTAPSLTAATTYYLVLYGSFAISSTSHIQWTTKSGNYYADGQGYSINGSYTWTAQTGYDFSFKIYGTYTATGVIESYSFDYLDTIYDGLRENVATTLMAQEFVAPYNSTLYSVKLYLSETGDASITETDGIWVEIHSAQGGTSETQDASTAIVGTKSNDISCAALNAFPTYAWHEFVFGGTQPVLVAGNTYYIVVYGDFTVSASAYVRVGIEKIDADFEGGSFWNLDASLNWTELDYASMIFEVLATASLVAGNYKYRVTYRRGGNYPCESNPSDATPTITAAANQEITLSNIPVSDESEVTVRRLYRTKAGGAIYYFLYEIENNSDTTFVDNIHDDSLGAEANYESYVPPAGKGVVIWDERLWVWGVDDFPEALFKSGQGTLEQFPTPASQFYALREGETDEIKAGVEYYNNLNILKRNSIWVISKDGEDYAQDKIIHGTGTIAQDSAVVCSDGIVRFLSNHMRIEELEGYRIKKPRMSDLVKTTLDDINEQYAFRSTAEDHPDKQQYRLAIPTGTNTYPDKVIVYNYALKEFYVDVYFNSTNQKITSISMVDTSQSERAMLYGTDAGELERVDDSATTDDGELIVCDLAFGWMGDRDWKVLRKMLINYILPEDATLVFQIFKNFEESPTVDVNLDGNTPTGLNPGLRDIILKRLNLGVHGYTYLFRFKNAEDVADLRLINFDLWMRTGRYKYSVETT